MGENKPLCHGFQIEPPHPSGMTKPQGPPKFNNEQDKTEFIQMPLSNPPSNITDSEAANTKLACHDEGCTVIGYQKSDISVPVTVIPYAKVGKIMTDCYGPPVIEELREEDKDTKDCHKKCCKFLITQSVIVAVPIEFGAEATTGEKKIKCTVLKQNK